MVDNLPKSKEIGARALQKEGVVTDLLVIAKEPTNGYLGAEGFGNLTMLCKNIFQRPNRIRFVPDEVQILPKRESMQVK